MDLVQLLNSLVGSYIESLDETGFVIRDKDNNLRHFDFVDDYGGCCGFNEITAALLTDKSSGIAITNVAQERVCDGADELKITFFGGSKKLATIESLSSSGSGYWYGASVSVLCRETNEDVELTSW